MARNIIVSDDEPPTICKIDEPTIWVYLSGDNAQAVAYSNKPFDCTMNEKAARVDINPPIYQASNFGADGKIKTHYPDFISEIQSRNQGKLEWSSAKPGLELKTVTA